MKVLFATDGSSYSRHALEQAVAWLPKEGLETHVIGVVPIALSMSYEMAGGVLAAPPMDYTLAEQAVKADVAEAGRQLAAAGHEAHQHIRSGEPADAILATAAEIGADLIVVGAHGRSGLERLLLGSVSEKVVRQGKGGVLVVRP